MVSLHSVFASHGVYQQNTTMILRGTAEGKTVRASIRRGKEVFCESEAKCENGRFALPLSTPTASPLPWEIRISDGEELTLTDILFGEVWLCAGQSNMGVSIRQMPGGSAYAKSLSGSLIRIYAQSEIGGRDPAADEYPFEPMEDMEGLWLAPSDGEHPDRLSALAVAVAKNLSEGVLAGVPIGMVQVSVGGTPMEAWLPLDVLAADEAGKELLLRERRFPTEENKNARDKIGCMMFQQASVLYNLKIAPLSGIKTRGIIWYQGEENLYSWFDRAHAAHYRRMMEMLRSRYGELFCPEKQEIFPVIGVQLFPFAYEKPGKEREEVLGYYNQMMGELSDAEPEKFTCVPIYDIPPCWNVADNSNIHPMNKFAVGDRLAKTLAAFFYGAKGMSRPGTMKEFFRREGTIFVKINTRGEKLRASGKPKGFWISDWKGLYREAEAEIVSEDTLRIYCPAVPEPAHVAYQYQTLQLDGNVYCGELPLCPFATDGVSALRIEPKPWLHTEQNRVWAHLDGYHALYEPVWRGERGTRVIADPLFTVGEGSLRIFGEEKTLVAYTKRRLGERLDLQNYKALEMRLLNLQKGEATLEITQSDGKNRSLTVALLPKATQEEDGWRRLTFDLTGISPGEISRLAVRICTDTPDAGVWMDGLRLI